MEEAEAAEDNEPAYLRDGVLLPLLEEFGAHGHLHRAAAVCKRWAAMASQMWPLVVKQWNATLQHDLRVESRSLPRCSSHLVSPSNSRTLHLLVHSKSAATLLVAQDLRFDRDPLKVVVHNDVVYAEWKEIKIVDVPAETFSRVMAQQVIRKRRPVTMTWTGRVASLAWAGEATQLPGFSWGDTYCFAPPCHTVSAAAAAAPEALEDVD